MASIPFTRHQIEPGSAAFQAVFGAISFDVAAAKCRRPKTAIIAISAQLT
jgi:hypothetical protein